MGAHRKIQLTKEELQKLYDETPTNRELADKLGISTTGLYDTLNREGIVLRKKENARIVTQTRDELERMLEEHPTKKAMAESLGVSTVTLYKVLRREGIIA